MKMGDPPSPIYEALDKDSLQIRLLYFDPCDGGDQVMTCGMTTASLLDDLKYHELAVLYLWQSKTD